VKIIAHSGQEFEIVRDLTEVEILDHVKYTPIVGEARDRLKLFKILQKNYSEWRQYLYSLLNPQPGNHDEEALELERLLLNYLTCAYTITEHFEVSFVQRFRKDPIRKKRHQEFIKTLCTKCWAFGFFLDFRGHVQHRGLGIGGYKRQISSKSVAISVSHDAESLLKESRGWKNCCLSGSEGKLDLITLLQEFHVQMLQSYAKFVSQIFFPELNAAAGFYKDLTEEAAQKKPGSRMLFASDEPKTSGDGSKTQIQLDLELPPNDLLSELGICLPQNVQR
jgi:hypothetical protein